MFRSLSNRFCRPPKEPAGRPGPAAASKRAFSFRPWLERSWNPASSPPPCRCTLWETD